MGAKKTRQSWRKKIEPPAGALSRCFILKRSSPIPGESWNKGQTWRLANPQSACLKADLTSRPMWCRLPSGKPPKPLSHPSPATLDLGSLAGSGSTGPDNAYFFFLTAFLAAVAVPPVLVDFFTAFLVAVFLAAFLGAAFFTAFLAAFFLATITSSEKEFLRQTIQLTIEVQKSS